MEARADGGADPDDPLGGAELDFDDEAVVEGARDAREDAAARAAQQMLADAMAGGFGLVDKIDFDELTFETDDE